ncbi:hypothetical protein IPM62_01160 [Candidatus Woesebacteria bacterium]|nr:MAG: hypothetical protein IPM62_01160 [Candidatus Woesebacteria bacterium]
MSKKILTPQKIMKEGLYEIPGGWMLHVHQDTQLGRELQPMGKLTARRHKTIAVIIDGEQVVVNTTPMIGVTGDLKHKNSLNFSVVDR